MAVGTILEGQVISSCYYADIISRALLDLTSSEMDALRAAPYTTHILRYDTI
jgi:hypothetical protein